MNCSIIYWIVNFAFFHVWCLKLRFATLQSEIFVGSCCLGLCLCICVCVCVFWQSSSHAVCVRTWSWWPWRERTTSCVSSACSSSPTSPRPSPAPASSPSSGETPLSVGLFYWQSVTGCNLDLRELCPRSCSSPDDQLDRVTLEPDSVSFMEALLAKGRGQATMQNGFCPAALQGERADVPERGGATVKPGVEANREKKSSTTSGLTCPVTLNKAVLLYPEVHSQCWCFFLFVWNGLNLEIVCIVLCEKKTEVLDWSPAEMRSCWRPTVTPSCFLTSKTCHPRKWWWELLLFTVKLDKKPQGPD